MLRKMATETVEIVRRKGRGNNKATQPASAAGNHVQSAASNGNVFPAGLHSVSLPPESGSGLINPPDIIMDHPELESALAASLSERGPHVLEAMNYRRAFGGHHSPLYPVKFEGFLQQREAVVPIQPLEDLRFVIDTVPIDLDTFVGSHTGISKTQRLLHIAKHCPQMRVDALKMILKHLVETSSDVALYHRVYDDLKSSLAMGLKGEDGDTSLPRMEENWMRDQKRSFDSRLYKLDIDLKNYKTNSIKESIRRGHDEIGNHYLSTGDATSALKSFNKARDYGEGYKEQAQTLANRLKACVYLQSFPNGKNLVDQMKDIGMQMECAKVFGKSRDKDSSGGGARSGAPVDKKLETAWNLVRACIALYHMSTGSFKDAADLFVTLDPECCEFPTVLIGRDIAIYGSLCAVATYDRQELRDKILNNKSFKSFLETTPEIRRLLEMFYGSKFREFLKAFDELRNAFLLDVLLARHVDKLYQQARRHGISEYFGCYDSVTLVEMAGEFCCTVPELQDELTKMIREGAVDAHIDSMTQTLNRQSIEKDVSHPEKNTPLNIPVASESKRCHIQVFEKSLSLRRPRGTWQEWDDDEKISAARWFGAHPEDLTPETVAKWEMPQQAIWPFFDEGAWQIPEYRLRPVRLEVGGEVAKRMRGEAERFAEVFEWDEISAEGPSGSTGVQSISCESV